MTENPKYKATASADMTRLLFQFAARQGVDLYHLETMARIDRFNLEEMKRKPVSERSSMTSAENLPSGT